MTHCLAGIGRTTTMLMAAYLVQGYALQDLAAWVRVRNPHYLFHGSQMTFSARTGRGRQERAPAGAYTREAPAAMPVTLTFHDSQYPARVAEQLRQGLRAKKLPGKFLYESPAQAQRWLAYHQAYAPSRTGQRCWPSTSRPSRQRCRRSLPRPCTTSVSAAVVATRMPCSSSRRRRAVQP